MNDKLFGKYCFIDTPWIAGANTRYRILGSGVRSNTWCEVPVTGRSELVKHDHLEEVVFVVLDTLVSNPPEPSGWQVNVIRFREKDYYFVCRDLGYGKMEYLQTPYADKASATRECNKQNRKENNDA